LGPIQQLTPASPKDEVQEIASKGGQSSHNSGFASMDADKQVRNHYLGNQTKKN
jgi:general stress protein YciG